MHSSVTFVTECEKIRIMKISHIDHLVITTQNLNACLHFYVDILNMKHEYHDNRHSLVFGNEKFNIHTRKAEFLPAAENPTYGSLDLCLIIDGDMNQVKQEIENKGYPIELGPVTRHGAQGEMTSIYLRDPDGNLIELSSYN